MTTSNRKKQAPPELRKFRLLLGNPPVKVAEYEAYTDEQVWEMAEEEYGSNTFWPDARLNEIATEESL